MNDPVLETLCLPLREGEVIVPEGEKVLLVRARFGAALEALARDQWVCAQSFKPEYDRLKQQGFTNDDNTGAQYGLVCVLTPRSREEYRALLAQAVTRTRPNGFVMAATSNLEGAKTVENDLKALCGGISSLSKNKCRVFWARVGEGIDRALLDTWLTLDAPRQVEGGLWSRPGLFAWDRIDAGSRLLSQNLPHLSGRGADLGAGVGYLSREVLNANPQTHMTLFEAEGRAVELAKRNIEPFADRAEVWWHDVTAGVSGAYDFIVMNPPFHTDRADRNDLGVGFIGSAAGALNRGGQLWMVANRHLPYEETLKTLFRTVTPVTDDGRYKVIKAVK